MTRKITSAQLDEIEATAKKATPDEWRVDGEQIEAGEFGEVIIPGPVLCGSYCYGGSSTIDGDHLAEDFAHIAMMDPATTLALVAEVRELRARLFSVTNVAHAVDASAGGTVEYCHPGTRAWRDVASDLLKALGEEA